MTFQDEDEIVISGMSGKFPDAPNVADLAQKLFAGINLVTKDERKLTKGFYEDLPEYNGKTQTAYSLFDNTFFGILPIVSAVMDPLTCQILQRTFEAVMDAGINPCELRGTNTSVFSGTCHSDADLEWAADKRFGYGIMGRNRCMNSNRVSYWLDLNGTSVSVDSGWTNGLTNLYLGWDAIRRGKCDIAIVNTASLQDNALITAQFKEFGFLSPDGISRTFDDAADGFGRSSAIVVLVLQRARFARRSYATIGHVYSTCFGDRNGILNKPTQREWEKLFREFYEQAKVDVNDVKYIEAYGASTKEDDAEELNAIAEVFCKDRKTPLLVGCVKSNMGHTEAAAPFCGIVKSVISMEAGVIPQNLNYKNPNSLCPGLLKGQIKIVDKNTPISSKGWIGVNAHGFGGSYAHLILKANQKDKKLRYDNIPRLVLLADRTNDYMSDLIEKVEAVPFDVEFVSLLHDIHTRKLEKYLGRGYTILPKLGNGIHDHQVYGEEKRPLWFIFSGMGSQWPKMGRRLMDLPLFRESIEKSHRILQDKGLDLIHIITTEDPNIFDNILHSFVGIAAIQVALVDVLKALNITPDGYIGHSVGELGCAYADNCFTAEQMVLAAYYRGKASTETELIKGSMAAIGRGYNDIKNQLPDGVEVACHNSQDSCTLSGPTDLIHKFVAELKEQGIFAKSVNVSNIAYHSRYIKPAAPKLLAYLKEVVKNPKLRSSKWISTSNPEAQWDTEVAKYCSAEYHTNNLLSSVLFEEGSKHIPKNAICIEIAPHGLLQAILKRSLGENVTNIPLTNRTADDPLIFLLQAIGKMYMAGVDPNVKNLYAKIEYPVSRGTHVLHHLVHWHEVLTVRAVTQTEKKTVYSFKNRLMKVADDGTGYVVNKQNTYPISIFLELVWDLVAAHEKALTEDCPVVFNNFRLERPLMVHLSEKDDVTITYAGGSGRFEIVTSDLIASGTVSLLKEKPLDPAPEMKETHLVGDEIYSELRRKGYDVGGNFKNLSAVSVGEKEWMGEIPSKANWVQTIESLIQLYILKTECPFDHYAYPRAFELLEISSVEHKQMINSLNGNTSLTASYDVITNTATCGGIKIRGLSSIKIPKTKSELKFPSSNFFPLINPQLEDSLRFADFCFSVVLDNIGAIRNLTIVNIMEVMEPNQTSSIGYYLQQFFRHFKINTKTVTTIPSEVNQVMDFVISPLSSLEQIKSHLVNGGFVFMKTSPGKDTPIGFNVIGKFVENSKDEYLLLKMAKSQAAKAEFVVMEGNEKNFTNSLRELKPSGKIPYIVSYKEPTEGIGSFKERMQSECCINLRWIFILDPKAPKFDSKNAFFTEQLKKGLSTNIYKNGSWGAYREFNFSESSLQDDMNLRLEWSEEITPSFVSFDLEEDVLRLQQVEYSGMRKNTKIMGISQLLQNKKITLDKYLTWEVPESWSLEDATTVPTSYVMAYYCLLIIGKLKKRERVMVTDGLTCIGQASIAVALENCSRVFVTVNNEKEAVLIKKLFPKIDEKDIVIHGFDFDLPWKYLVKDDFADIIMNTLEGHQFFSLINCTGLNGRFFHFGRKLLEDNTPLGTSAFLLSLALEYKNSESLMRLKEDEKKQLQKLVSDGIKKGTVKPLSKVVISFDELKKLKSSPVSPQNRLKTVLAVDTLKPNTSFVRFDINSSYVVVGDETDTWIDVTEWLIHRSLQNIVISYQDNTKRTQLFVPSLKKHKNIFLYNHKDVPTLLQKAEKLGPISSVYYLSMTSAEVSESLMALDKSYRNPKGFLFALTKSQGRISELCKARNNSGFPSTNFVWDADEMIINEHLEFMGKLCGRDPVVNVSPHTTLSTSDQMLVDLLPSTIDDFCDIGASVREEVRITVMNTLCGTVRDVAKEISPIIFIPGLQKEPVKLLEPIAAKLWYPALCVEIPNLKLSLPQMASCILPEIIKVNKVNAFNIVGISWGTHLAMELAKLLEETGAVVGVVLIDGPFFNTKSLLVKSLESDLLNVFKGWSKSGTNLQGEHDVFSEKTWQGQLNTSICALNLPPEKEKDFCRAATFIYNNLKALLDQDTTAINIKGPLSILVRGEQSFDDKLLWKLSKSLCIRCLPDKNGELLTSNEFWETIHGSAVTQSMNKDTVPSCSTLALEEFTSNEKIIKYQQSLRGSKLHQFLFFC